MTQILKPQPYCIQLAAASLELSRLCYNPVAVYAQPFSTPLNRKTLVGMRYGDFNLVTDMDSFYRVIHWLYGGSYIRQCMAIKPLSSLEKSSMSLVLDKLIGSVSKSHKVAKNTKSIVVVYQGWEAKINIVDSFSDIDLVVLLPRLEVDTSFKNIFSQIQNITLECLSEIFDKEYIQIAGAVLSLCRHLHYQEIEGIGTYSAELDWIKYEILGNCLPLDMRLINLVSRIYQYPG